MNSKDIFFLFLFLLFLLFIFLYLYNYFVNKKIVVYENGQMTSKDVTEVNTNISTFSLLQNGSGIIGLFKNILSLFF